MLLLSEFTLTHHSSPNTGKLCKADHVWLSHSFSQVIVWKSGEKQEGEVTLYFGTTLRLNSHSTSDSDNIHRTFTHNLSKITFYEPANL